MPDALAELYAAIEKARTLSPTRLGRVVSGLGKRYPGLKLDANIGSAGEIKVSRIVVPKEQRGKGIGTKAMRTLNRVADHHEKRSALSPSKDFGGSVPRLKRFYGALGYKPNKGKRKDFAIRETMIREPRVRKSAGEPMAMDCIDDLYSAIEKARPLLARLPGGTRAGLVGGRYVSVGRSDGKRMLNVKESNGTRGYNLGNKDSKARGKKHLQHMKRSDAPYYQNRFSKR